MTTATPLSSFIRYCTVPGRDVVVDIFGCKTHVTVEELTK